MEKNNLNDPKLEALFAKAEFHLNNLRRIFDGLKGRKICSECGIDYDENTKHDCDTENNNDGGT